MPQSSGLTVAVTGATGEIGKPFVRALEQTVEVGCVQAMARRPFDPRRLDGARPSTGRGTSSTGPRSQSWWPTSTSSRTWRSSLSRRPQTCALPPRSGVGLPRGRESAAGRSGRLSRRSRPPRAGCCDLARKIGPGELDAQSHAAVGLMYVLPRTARSASILGSWACIASAMSARPGAATHEFAVNWITGSRKDPSDP